MLSNSLIGWYLVCLVDINAGYKGVIGAEANICQWSYGFGHNRSRQVLPLCEHILLLISSVSFRGRIGGVASTVERTRLSVIFLIRS